MDSGFQSPGSRIPPSKFPRFQIQQAKQFPGFRIWIPLHGASLGPQANPFTVFFLSKMRTIIPEHSQIISSSSRWVRKVELCNTYIYNVGIIPTLYVDLYLSGWHWPILWDRDRGFDHSTLPYSRVNSKCRWERIVKTDFGLKVVIEKTLFHMHKLNMWSAQPLTPWKPVCSSFNLPKIASLIRPSKTSLQTLTGNLTLNQKCDPSHSCVEILISHIKCADPCWFSIKGNENNTKCKSTGYAMLNSLYLLLFWEAHEPRHLKKETTVDGLEGADLE